jgi:hypothetical protein
MKIILSRHCLLCALYDLWLVLLYQVFWVTASNTKSLTGNLAINQRDIIQSKVRKGKSNKDLNPIQRKSGKLGVEWQTDEQRARVYFNKASWGQRKPKTVHGMNYNFTLNVMYIIWMDKNKALKT